ncbi:MAG: GntR family transcriptional regulator [Longicatena sp.]
MFIIDTQSKLPIFEQLKRQILEFITIGVLSPKDKLPSVRSLASEIGVNPNTVSKAYQELEAQGYIYTEKGKGCFVSDNQSDKTIRMEKIKEFDSYIREMKQYHIQEEELHERVTQVYKEGN